MQMLEFLVKRQVIKIDKNKSLFSLRVADFQWVSKDLIGRELTDDELRFVGQTYENMFNWKKVIEDTITLCLNLSNKKGGD